jgi:hypothetical protein
MCADELVAQRFLLERDAADAVAAAESATLP